MALFVRLRWQWIAVLGHIGLACPAPQPEQPRPGRFGVEHGHTVFRELVSVPLILHGPGIPADVEPRTVRNLDLAPTLLGLAGLPARVLDGDGIDLLSRGTLTPGSALSETRAGGPPQQSLVSGGHQLVRIGADELVFDTTRPGWPGVEPTPTTRTALASELDETLEQIRRVRVREGFLDAETVEVLRALGYVQ